MADTVRQFSFISHAGLADTPENNYYVMLNSRPFWVAKIMSSTSDSSADMPVRFRGL
jgi:hypothetical protein